VERRKHIGVKGKIPAKNSHLGGGALRARCWPTRKRIRFRQGGLPIRRLSCPPHWRNGGTKGSGSLTKKRAQEKEDQRLNSGGGVRAPKVPRPYPNLEGLMALKRKQNLEKTGERRGKFEGEKKGINDKR